MMAFQMLAYMADTWLAVISLAVGIIAFLVLGRREFLEWYFSNRRRQKWEVWYWRAKDRKAGYQISRIKFVK